MKMEYVLFHCKKVSPFRPCHDGLFAAYAASLALPQASLIPAMYGQPPAIAFNPGDRIFLLDLTYPAPVLEAWADLGAEIIVIDHHKQAMDDLKWLSRRIQADFDLTRSGAVMAWEYFHPDEPVPDIFRYVQDRDLWHKQLPGCDTVHAGLAELFDEKTVEQCLAAIAQIDLVNVKAIGESVELELNAAVASAVKRTRIRTVLGHSVPFVLCRTKREYQAYSDIGNALAKAYPRSPFAVVQTGGGWALRSVGFDVARLAKTVGGGGHQCAAGCAAELPAWIERIVDRAANGFRRLNRHAN